MKRLLKNNLGMTLMEILVALTLLMIVIVGTTPVMLSAFDGLYTAGEFTQDTYEAKSEVEDKLATRNTKDIYNPGFQVNFQNIGEVANINARRAVSSLYGSLETLFSNGKVHIAIVSAKNVNDDYAGDGYHEVIIQTSNLDFGDDVKKKSDAAAKIAINTESDVVDGDADREKIIDLTFIKPNKQADGDAKVYTYKDDPSTTDVVETAQLANVDYSAIDVDHVTGRITVRINGFDFTQSPIKIRASYLDENNKKQTTETYLFIDQPTIMAVGETNKTDANGNRIAYYTTPGVVEVPVKGSTTGAKEKVFEIYPRTMRIENVTSTQTIPANTIFKSANWITESTKDGELTDNAYNSSYYVITGTNGVIYRTYTMKSTNDILGKVTINADDSEFGINGLKLNTLTGASQLREDVVGMKDKDIILADKYATLVYPAFWGGDFSHIFGWSAYGEEAGYTERTNPTHPNGTWYTQHSSDVTTNDSDSDGTNDTRVEGIGSAGYYSNLAAFGYYYNGYALNTPYYSMNSKKISYVLTEVPYAMRIGAFMGDVGSVDDYGYDGTTLDRIWEQPNYADGEHQNELFDMKYSKDSTQAWYYAAPNSSMPRSVIVQCNEGANNFTNNCLKTLPVYMVNNTGDNEGHRRPDQGFAQLRIKALTTLSPETVYNRGGHTDEPEHMRVAYDYNDNYSKITVTDSVYLPATDSTPGGMFYIGTVAAYSLINQVDNIGINDDGPDVEGVNNNATSNTGRMSSYWVVSDDNGTTTTIYKTSQDSDGVDHVDKDPDEYDHDLDHEALRQILMDETTRKNNYFGTTATDLDTPIKVNSAEAKKFFITQPLEVFSNTAKESGYGFLGLEKKSITRYYYREKVSGRVFSDVCFTMGYTSNREIVYTNIVYGKDENGDLVQSLKFCEPYYFQSHYDKADKNPYLYMNSSTDNASETKAYLNNVDNDYYNVWFPGEMYNLTKTATKDGVTVAVGYAVAGSSYTYHNTYKNASTALGGIFNDGVLAGMVLGQDAAFTNLLYYKDNKTFDSTSLTSGDVQYKHHGYPAEQSSTEGSLKDYTDLGSTTWTTYGMHTRDSVQFTAVDLSIEKTDVVKDATTGEALSWTDKYYAYYADNKGRVYRSLVATKNDDGSVEMVSHIADQEKVLDSNGNSTRNAPSYMEEQKIGGKSIGDYFEKITSIKADGGLVIVSGYSKEGFCIAVGEVSEEGNAPTWKIVKGSGCDATYKVNDMLIRDGYVYIAGSKTSGGFVFAVEMAALKVAANNGTVSGKTATTAGALYAIAGQ